MSQNIITLSSSDDESNLEPPKKRIKPTPVKPREEAESVLLISSDEEDTKNKPNSKSNKQKTAENDIEIISNTSSEEIKERNDKELDSDDSSEGTKDESSKENKNENSEEPVPHSFDESTANEKLQIFLDTCTKSIKNSKYETLLNKYSNMQNLFKKYIKSNGFDDDIKKLLDDNAVNATQSSHDAVLGFNSIFEHMKSSVDEPIEVPAEHQRKVRKLLKAMMTLLKRIKKLEEAEVNWDDDNDSAYIQEDRYKQRLAKVFDCYCKYVKMNPHAGRITYKKLDFVSSNYDEINQAVNKKCKNKLKFPNYADMEKIVRQCVEDHGLNLSEKKVKRESEMCFKALGELLQKRRKHELYESHYNFIKDIKDPAQQDKELDKQLKTSFMEGLKKIEAICESYVDKQNAQKGEVELSEDSDDSNFKDSDEDDDK